MAIRAVLFDCDGLMFETELLSQRMYRESAEKFGVDLPEDFFVRITGGYVTPDFYEIPGLDKVLDDMKGKRMDISFWRSCAKDTLNKKGLIQLWQYLRAHGYMTAVCSSSFREYVETLIGTVSVPLVYDVIVCGDMVRNRKPDPEIFLRAAELLGVASDECLVLEDSRNGIIAANRAGMHSCFIEDTIAPDAEMKAQIEYSRDDLEQVIGLLEDLNGGNTDVGKI
ncbi:MAG: HAD family phosphatase [Solobacterium sp.]|nr:HAD family phosphatase [Solobacterium sp.]